MSILLLISIVYLIIISTLYQSLQLSSTTTNIHFASVIVAVRNKEQTIERCLKSLMAQNYGSNHYEILVVNDQSTDKTRNVLERFQKNSPIRVFNNPDSKSYKSSKKSALEYAIAHAAGDIMIFTDADCYPGPDWLSGMITHFDESTGLVAGFSPQHAQSGLFDDILIIDAAAAAVVSSASITKGRGVTCTGRNLACRKKAFMDIGGFSLLPDSLSGDDDFILQQMSKHPSWKVTYSFDPKTVVEAQGPLTWDAFLRQKRRHISAGKNYSPADQFFYALFHALNLLLWGFAILGLFTHIVYCLPLVLKFIVDSWLLKRFLVHFKFHLPWFAFLIWEGIFVFYNTCIGPLGLYKTNRW